MFELDKNIVLQKKFAQIHNYLLVIILVYYLSLYFVTDSLILFDIIGIFVLVGLCYIDTFFSKKDYFNSMKIVTAIRIFELFAAGYYIFFRENIRVYSVIIAVVMYLFISMELLFLFDVIDSFYRIPYTICVNLPLSISFLFKIVFKSSEMYFNSLYFFFIVITTIVLYHTSSILATVIKEFTDKLFAQTRIINNADQANIALKENQKKIKRANEQLGLQKVELEAAYNKINRVNSEMMIQAEILKYISASLDIENLMELITDSVSGSFGTDLCAIILNVKDKYNDKTLSNVKVTLDRDYLECFENCIKNNFFEEVIKAKKTIIDNNVKADKYEFIKNEEIDSLLMLPLIKDGEAFGVFVIGHKARGYFVDNINFFEGVVSQFIIAFNNAQLYSQMQNMAIRDALTGIYNRGYLTQLFNRYSQEAQDNNTLFAVALFDIDKFKNINDTYGHPFGDVVIQEIASIADDITTKNKGYVGRYGGEEFVILLPGKNLNEAYKILDEVHSSIKAKELYHNDELVKVNVSIGITVYPETCDDSSELLDRADSAMYYSKQNGRGRITVDSSEIRSSVNLK